MSLYIYSKDLHYQYQIPPEHQVFLCFQGVQKWNIGLKWANLGVEKLSIFFMKHTKASSSHQRCSLKKGFLKISQNSQEKSLFFNKVAGLRPVTLLKKTPWQKCFPVNFLKFFFQKSSCEIFKSTFFTEQLLVTASAKAIC